MAALSPELRAKRIVVIGAGAVGGYIGAHLAHGGADVTLVDPWPEHVRTVRADGLEITGMTAAETIRPHPRILHLTEVQAFAKEKPIDVAVVSFQNMQTGPQVGTASDMIPHGRIIKKPQSGPRRYQRGGHQVMPTITPTRSRAVYQLHTAIAPRK